MHNMFFLFFLIYLWARKIAMFPADGRIEMSKNPSGPFKIHKSHGGCEGRSGLQSWGLWKADSYRLRVLRRTVGDAGDCCQISAIVNTEVWWSMCIFKLLPVAPCLVLKKSACSTRFYTAACMLVAVNRCDNSTMTMPIFYLELHANTCLGELRGAKKEPLQLQSGEDSMIVCRRKFLQVVS